MAAVTAPAPAALLDDVPGAGAAYSLRKIRDAYAGGAITVRRSSDNSVTDIGFTGSGQLDTAALLTFVGSGDAYVTRWYDQTTSGLDVVQATESKQPQIVAAGSVITSTNGAVALKFQGSNNTSVVTTNDALHVSVPSTLYDDAGATVIAAGAFATEPGSTQIVQRFFSLQASNSTRLTMGGDDGLFAIGYRNSGSFVDANTSFDPVLNETFVATLVSDATGVGATDVVRAYANGSEVYSITGRTITTDDDTLVIGALGTDGLRALNGTMNEIILFSNVLSTSDRQTVEASQAVAYVPEPGGIFLLAASAALPLMVRRRQRN